MSITTRPQRLAPINVPEMSSNDTDIRRISGRVMNDILDGKLHSNYGCLYIIDCRSPYEYQRGHIRGAINQWAETGINRLLFKRNLSKRKALIVLHCEYSEIRAPRMQVSRLPLVLSGAYKSRANHIRQQDRQRNGEDYPRLTYPDIWILEGGFRTFYGAYENLCDGVYVTEKDAKARHLTFSTSRRRHRCSFTASRSLLEELRACTA
jgi:M-phase inducer tyrosine phosphatase